MKQLIEEYSKDEIKQIVVNMFYAATGYEPYEELVGLFTYIGIKRTAEILCCYKQSPKIRNHLAWFRRAIAEEYKPSDIPIKKDKKVTRRPANVSEEEKVPFYDWLNQS